MQIRELKEFSKDEVVRLLSGLPFYKQVEQQDPLQLDLILQNSKIVELEPGETIMRRGDHGSWLYFLLKGRLAVFAADEDDTPVNYITSGELFGDLAMLSQLERRATVRADTSTRRALLFATDFNAFGELEDFSLIRLGTKLTFYRMMVHGIRWKLELNRQQQPDHPLVKPLLDIRMFSGQRDSVEELLDLRKQAEKLADLLIQWNTDSGDDSKLLALQGNN